MMSLWSGPATPGRNSQGIEEFFGRDLDQVGQRSGLPISSDASRGIRAPGRVRRDWEVQKGLGSPVRKPRYLGNSTARPQAPSRHTHPPPPQPSPAGPSPPQHATQRPEPP